MLHLRRRKPPPSRSKGLPGSRTVRSRWCWRSVEASQLLATLAHLGQTGCCGGSLRPPELFVEGYLAVFLSASVTGLKVEASPPFGKEQANYRTTLSGHAVNETAGIDRPASAC